MRATAKLNRFHASLVISLLAALTLGLSLLLPVPTAAAADTDDELYVMTKGHTDVFHLDRDATDPTKVILNVKEDESAYGVRRDPENIIFGVIDQAYSENPNLVKNLGAAGYYLPDPQNHSLLWPGWDSLEANNSGFKENRFVFDEVTGPGDVYLFQAGSLGVGLVSPLSNGAGSNGFMLQTGAYIRQTYAAHVHANWLFTAPGIYKFTVHAEGDYGHGPQKTNTEVYTFAVGQKAIDEATAQWHQKKADEAAAAQKAEEERLAQEEAERKAEEERLAAEKAEQERLAEEARKAQEEAERKAEEERLARESAEQKAEEEKQAKEEAERKAEEAGQAEKEAESKVEQPSAGAEQSSSVPAEQPQSGEAEQSDEQPAEEQQPSTSSNTKLGDSHTVPANTHVHQNWVFTAPGTYDVTIEQTATLKNGEKVSTEGTIRFVVGDQGNANEGHFDIGTVSDGNSIEMLIKDDRTQPPNWVTPDSLQFGLGDAAKRKAPAGIEFIADRGQDIWMIGSTQEPNVPWVGANTQHPDLIKHTMGEVEWTLKNVTGPGSLAVFEFGAFGALGPIWFGGIADGTAGLGQSDSQKSDDGKNQEGRGKSEQVKNNTKNEGTSETSGSGAGGKLKPGGGGKPTGGAGFEGGKVEQCIPTAITEKVERPKAGSGSGTKLGGSYTVPKNTHVHQNWVFTAPGTYDLTFRQTATLTSGDKASTTGTIRFIVGGQGNANEGHFDIGTISDGKSIKMLIKDDRTQPAKWVEPSSLTFGLGNAAKTTAPAGIEFIADPGQEIWMIGSVQVPNVPWVGANTQHPDLLKNTTGEVTWTLIGATGPGSVGVFGSGQFGSIGEIWFGGRAAASTGETELVDQEVWVGRTKDGEACDLTVEQMNQLCAEGKQPKGYQCPAGTGPGKLSHTGASTAGATAAALALVLAGIALVSRRERSR